MARHAFGGDLTAWVFTVGAGNVVSAAAGAPVTFWTARTGGDQITDLSLTADGSDLVSAIETGGGTAFPDLAPGDMPMFWGPDNIVAMWAEAGGEDRKLMLASDVLPLVMTLADAQLITGTKTFNTGDPTRSTIILEAATTGQVADLLVAYSGSDTGQGGQRQRATYLNEKGELRVICAKANSVGVRIKGQPGQTAHVLEQTDTANNALAWWEPNGSWRAPNLGHTLPWSHGGDLVVKIGKHKIYNDTGVPLQIRAVRASVGSAPAGGDIRIDINLNGTTIFTTQGNRPTITAGQITSGRVANPDVTIWPDGGYLTADIDAVGSTPGSDLTVQVLAY